MFCNLFLYDRRFFLSFFRHLLCCVAKSLIWLLVPVYNYIFGALIFPLTRYKGSVESLEILLSPSSTYYKDGREFRVSL